jgi:hypothetical protein
VLASLTDTVSENDTKHITKMLIAAVLNPVGADLFQGFFQFSPALFTKGWQSPKGKAAAEKMAYKSLSWNDYLELPATVVGFAVVKHGALPAKTSQEQEELVWQTAASAWRQYQRTGKLTKDHAYALAPLWLGFAGKEGWAAVAPKLDTSLRGPLAYVLGQRMLRHKKYADARALFQAAARDAPADSPLARLAQAEVRSLDKKTK